MPAQRALLTGVLEALQHDGGRREKIETLNLESLPLLFKTYSESVCMPFQQLAQTALGRWFQQFDLQTPVWCNGLTREARGPR